jgi:hypothetical protein
MGLFVPHRDLDRLSSDPDGWTSYGDPLEYERFDVELTRGDQDRTIAGAPAAHYRLAADVIAREEGDGAYMQSVLTSDVWIREDAPFSSAPLSVDRAYADPRLQAALAEALGELGMIVRIQSQYRNQARSEEGEALGYPHEGTHLAWASEIEPASVRAVDVPIVSETTWEALRDAARENREAACETALAGGAPDFVETLLDADQREAFLPHLRERCEGR